LDQLDNITNYIKNEGEAEENNLEMLFTFFKEYIRDIGENFTCPIYNTVNKGRKTNKYLSSNNIQNFDLKDFFSSVAKETKNNPPEGIREIILQNIQIEEEILKIMVISKNENIKSILLTKFINDSSIYYPPEK
jgi:hypothetical protein